MVIQQQIKSVKEASNPKPWYDVQINSGLPEIVSDNDGGTTFDMSGASANTPSWSSAASPPAASMTTDVIYAVTESGDFVAYTPGASLSSHGVSLRAHLAWYDSAANEFTILDFVEQ